MGQAEKRYVTTQHITRTQKLIAPRWLWQHFVTVGSTAAVKSDDGPAKDAHGTVAEDFCGAIAPKKEHHQNEEDDSENDQQSGTDVC